jgi:hypothetical protein
VFDGLCLLLVFPKHPTKGWSGGITMEGA